LTQPSPENLQLSHPHPAPREPQAKPGQLRDAYLPNRRVRLSSDIASGCAVGLLLGVLATTFTWNDRVPLFDLAASPLQTVKLGLGYLAGPLLIMVVLPLVLGRARQVAIKRWYRERLLLAGLLWVAGMVVLYAKLAGLEGYTVQIGTYVTGAFLVVGLIATLLMWPDGLDVVKVDRTGAVRKVPDA
jgi:hypothetical protein